MALDSNVQVGRSGEPLSHFTPYPTPQSRGVNMFAQRIHPSENCYVFPPQVILSPTVHFVLQENLNCTIVVPMKSPTPAWLPNLASRAIGTLTIGRKGDTDVLLYPSKKGFQSDKKGLPWPLQGIRINHHNRIPPSLSPPPLSTAPGGRAQPTVVLGDSLVRFLAAPAWEDIHRAKIISIGGATLQKLENALVHHIRPMRPGRVIVHGGSNNVNKVYLPAAPALARCEL